MAGYGQSWLKGTQTLIDLWAKHPNWPPLTIVLRTKAIARTSLVARPNITYITDFIADPDLRRLQNRHGIQLCPSEAEGFGHYIDEARSTGAVVVTTDAPPMKEFKIASPEHRARVLPANTKKMGVSFRYKVDPEDLERCIESVLAMPLDELKVLGMRNREYYLRDREPFFLRVSGAKYLRS